MHVTAGDGAGPCKGDPREDVLVMFFQVFPELGVKHCVYQLVLFWLFEGPGLELATGRRRPAGYGRVVNFPAGSFSHI